jgi:hypothetical protein
VRTSPSRRDDKTEFVYQNLVWQFYNFYQFGANTLFALTLLYSVWLARLVGTSLEQTETFPLSRVAVVTVLLAVVDYVLYQSAKNSLDRYDDRRSRVLALLPPAPVGDLEKQSA